MNRAFFVLIAAALCASCGTVSTTLTNDDTARQRLGKMGTRCQTLPRVYSGVTYDFCTLNAEPRVAAGMTSGIPLVFLDILVSGVADTLALPYTVYLQSRDGSLQLH